MENIFCPFCNKKVKIEKRVLVTGEKVFCLQHIASKLSRCPIATEKGENTIIGRFFYPTEALAIKAWNKRSKTTKEYNENPELLAEECKND